MQAEIFLASHARKENRKCGFQEEETLTFFFFFSFPLPICEANKSSTCVGKASETECEEQRQGRPAVPLLSAGTARHEHPLCSAAGGRSQETEVLKLENRCRRK